MSGKSKNTKGLQPKLRFREFHNAGDWESKELGKIVELVTEKADNQKFILMSITSGVGLVSQMEKFGREIAGAAYKNYFVIRKNDFAYNKSATKEYPEGYIAMYSGENKGAVPNSIFTCFRIQDTEVAPMYLNYLFTCNLHGKWLRNFLTIGARAHGSLNVDNNDLLSLPVPVPIGNHSKKEQQKIADCLSSLDELIEAEDQKLDALQQHKKGLMQELFPAEGETLPKRRFPEFKDAPEWEGKKLGQIGDVLMCKRIFADETNDKGGIPFFKIGTLGGKPDAFINKELFEDYKSRYKYPRKGEILITCSGTVGKCLSYDGNDAYYQDSNIVWIDNPTLEVSNEFLLSLLSNKDWGSLNSTTIARIYGSDLRDLSIVFPADKKEQQRIADFLSSIDDLITAQSQKLDALRTHKKGLMQQIFPTLSNESEG